MAAGTVRVSRRGVEFLAAAIALDQIWATPGVELEAPDGLRQRA